ncbi:hypothetical protein K0M31_000451 [Melipona bicolor]|uniref:Uncharacterized protein n=1 Tax=Melipona bicolor TaxID=60889 RepID=A0AA40GED0_9HYME|nr:hypothetical protein K0M31_000451 [Melipona bicolor]
MEFYGYELHGIRVGAMLFRSSTLCLHSAFKKAKGKRGKSVSRKTHANPRGAKWGALAKFPIIHA